MRPNFRDLTHRQRAVFATVSHFYEATEEPVAAAFVARRLGITKQRVAVYFRDLHRLGWLRGPGAPAIPARGLWRDR